ncbi:hypothetical protein [Herbiconiux sp. YIM B11900]|uniref:hypothetical protein n=1 Tax=Herbiconiux sp. YIM B11900 TaxID=3404131 RepID=UPI003F86F017
MIEIVESIANRRLHHERARAFGLPVLRSLHPNTLLVGYSFVGDERSPGEQNDRIVEANHVVRSSLETSNPLSFTTRTWKFGRDLEVEFHLHAMNHLRNGTLVTASAPALSKEEHFDLRQKLADAERRAIDIRIDGVPRSGYAIALHGSTFVRLAGGDDAAMLSIAGPPDILDAGFASDIPL